MNPDSIGLGQSLPTVLLEEVTRRAFDSHATTALFAGFGVLGLGFLYRITQEVWRDIQGEKPDYVTPLVALVGFAALISVYQPFVKGCIHIITHLGSNLLTGEPLDTSFRHRAQGFADNWKADAGRNPFGMMSTTGLISGILQTMTILGYALVTWSAGILRLGQTFMLAVIITYGPLSLGCASLGGMFSVLGLAWFWALVEVCAWSLTLDILNYVFAPLGRDLPHAYFWVSEIMLCLSLFVLIASVPLITSMLVRSQAAAMMPRSNVLSLGTAVSAAATTTRYGSLVMQARPRQGAQDRAWASPGVHAGQGASDGRQSPSHQGPPPPAAEGGGMPPRPPGKSPWMQKFTERMDRATRRKR